ncbi:hypothetical protein [Ketogulonicigenium vulgare]|uniref:Membrane protein, putative n=1 Tax=Ketogulonicigenium vulgare (strain WSH-001) TaxID=759362 RepID=F9Y676_KETVW|nr:hypothetical protein [Ketogulonicigenium vulgare]ADO43810.1 membrane protein, putative [Ketogulonicigenium vulgare Y25]AEM42073.1 Membrane protein, putative [Ketogulonicigenium vulgare WSH-001]ALJ82166.1 hypothetical protein KVH_13930 [Ketogulonicigenium vulgare]ANW34787.1 hypothetical protein KvSKV_13840 [Ketogulonicigenium vulgare]AOZ55844.1 membrane protein, putative [Ketogulonicigenium vulgare]
MTTNASLGRETVRHGISMVLRNWRQALAVSVGPALIGIACLFGLQFATGVDVFGLMTYSPGPEEVPSFEELLTALIIFVVFIFISAWTAVSWHRFVLLEEYPGLLPRIPQNELAGYMWKTIVVSAMLVLILVPVSAVIGIMMMGLVFLPSIIVGTLGGFAITLVVMWLSLRFGLVLPAASVGAKMGVFQAWRATNPVSGQIFVIAVIVTLLNVVLSLIVSVFDGISPMLSFGLNIGVLWFSTLLGLCLLTTLYGVLVEGRELPAH